MPASHKGYRNKLLRTVERTIGAYRMFQAGDSVLAGVSGGPDSVALLHVLNILAPRLSIKLGVAHLNHCLRLEASDRDAEFVKSLALKLGLPCYTHRVDVGKYRSHYRLSTEVAARHVRYTFYNDIAKTHNFNKIALGHHSDDNAELVLLYLFRGSGPLGISGIPPVRNETIVRPLIESSRAEILDFLAAKGLEHVCDESNTDLRFQRNRLRHQLIPMLNEYYNPLVVQSINRFSSILRSEDEWIETYVTSLFDSAVSVITEGRIGFSISKLNKLHIAAVRRIVRRAISTIKGDLKRVSFKHIDAVTRLLQRGPVYGRLDLPGRISVRRDPKRLFFSKETKPLRHFDITSKAAGGRNGVLEYEYEIKGPETLFVKEINLHIKFLETGIKNLPDFRRTGHIVAFFDMDKLGFPLILRNFRPGDRFTPLGMTGTQSVKKYFSNNKISRAERAVIPILLSKGKIVWVVGHRIAESVKVRPETRNLLKVERVLAE